MLFLQIIGQLTGGGCFTSALQAYQHDYCRRLLGYGQLALGAAQELNQFLVNDFNDLLMGIQALANLSAQSTLLNLSYKVLNNLKVYVGL